MKSKSRIALDKFEEVLAEIDHEISAHGPPSPRDLLFMGFGVALTLAKRAAPEGVEEIARRRKTGRSDAARKSATTGNDG